MSGLLSVSLLFGFVCSIFPGFCYDGHVWSIYPTYGISNTYNRLFGGGSPFGLIGGNNYGGYPFGGYPTGNIGGGLLGRPFGRK